MQVLEADGAHLGGHGGLAEVTVPNDFLERCLRCSQLEREEDVVLLCFAVDADLRYVELGELAGSSDQVAQVVDEGLLDFPAIGVINYCVLDAELVEAARLGTYRQVRHQFAHCFV